MNEYKTGQAVPTLYVGGALSKEWKNDGRLYKYGDVSVELQCIKLCKNCGILVENAFAIKDCHRKHYLAKSYARTGRSVGKT